MEVNPNDVTVADDGTRKKPADWPGQLPRRIPVRIGTYLIEKVIGRGGMGMVCKARQEGLNRTVALKLLLLGENASPALHHRFVREAKAMAKLRHPNIVTVHEVGEYENQPFFTMDYIEGGISLDEYMNCFSFDSTAAVAELLATLADAVHYAHTQGIVHRDLKPGNILMDAREQPLITDFGLAKDLDDDSMLSMSGDILGTPAFMSPEQAAGKVSKIDARSDVYSLGAILYWMLTRRHPFSGTTMLETLGRVLHDDPPVISDVNPEVEPELVAICLKAMDKERQARYQSARAMAEDLRRFIKGYPVLAGQWNWRRAVLRAMRRNRTALLVAGLVAVALVITAVAAAVFFNRSYLDFARRQAASAEAAVRAEAVAGLGRELLKPDQLNIQDAPEARKLLLDSLRDPDPRVRTALLRFLAEHGAAPQLADGISQEFAARLIAMADDPGASEQRPLILQAIGKLPGQKFTAYLIGGLNEPNPVLKLGIVRSLGERRAWDAIGPLVNVMVADPVCRAEAEAALGKLYDNSGRQANPEERLTSRLVAQMAAAVAKHTELIADPGGELKSLDKNPYARYEEALASAEVNARLKAIHELGLIRGQPAVALLLNALADSHPDVGGAAALHLAKLDPGDQAAVLLEKLKDGSPVVRGNAALALGFSRRAADLDPLLVALATEPTPAAQQKMIRALGELGLAAAAPGLRSCAEKNPALQGDVENALRRLANAP